jgi:uncharacterized iron-regulated membrane protein
MAVWRMLAQLATLLIVFMVTGRFIWLPELP